MENRSSTLCFLMLLVWPLSCEYQGYNSSDSWLLRNAVVLTATGEKLVGDRALPRNFDWRNVNGQSLVAADVNQHIPQYCGACWIHGTVAQLNDRIKIMRRGAFPEVMLSRQSLINCVPGEDGSAPGCLGGDSVMIYDYMLKNKVPDETCNPYQAQNAKCEPYNVCRNCKPPLHFMDDLQSGKDLSKMNIDWSSGCYEVPSYIGYGVKEYGNVNGSEAMMKEIYARGPISCSMDANPEFMFNYSANAEKHDGVFVTDAKSNGTDHIIEVAGWGETPSGLKFWIARNSWGTYWGQGGWFKLQRGVNTLLIEGDCSWAVPEFGEESILLEGKVLGDYVSGPYYLNNALATGFATQESTWHVPIAGQMFIVAAVSVFATAAFLGQFSGRRIRAQFPLLG